MVYFFRTLLEVEMVLLAIGAHPDDVEIGAFGTLARFVNRGIKLLFAA